MMTKGQLSRKISEHMGGAIMTNRKDLAACLGCSPSSVDKFLRPLPRVGRLYYIDDVAEEIVRQRQWN